APPTSGDGGEARWVRRRAIEARRARGPALETRRPGAAPLRAADRNRHGRRFAERGCVRLPFRPWRRRHGRVRARARPPLAREACPPRRPGAAGCASRARGPDGPARAHGIVGASRGRPPDPGLSARLAEAPRALAAVAADARE